MRPVLGLLLLMIVGCTNKSNQAEMDALKKQVAELQMKIDSLKPGLGEIMGNVQRHHEKLYYAGHNENWELAKFEAHEVEENLERGTEIHEHAANSEIPLKDLRKFTDLAVEEIERAISAKDQKQFHTGFEMLTKTCNQCHLSTGFGFISIKIPQASMFTSQAF